MSQAYYAYKTPTGLFELRQCRYKALFDPDEGGEHPHDVCAMAATLGQLKSIVERHFIGGQGAVDWSGLEAP